MYFTGDTLGRYELKMENGVLKLGSNFILKPISETEIIILSGAFVGETMTYDENTKSIYWSRLHIYPGRNLAVFYLAI
jgi:hypothetical protein